MTSQNLNSIQEGGGCACGSVRYAIKGTPLFRAFCHCETCQAYNQADFADIIILRSRDVVLNAEDQIDYRFHQWPPALKRGKCKQCGGVAIEKIHLPLSSKLTIIPTQTLHRPEDATEPTFHMFYHRRVTDVHDSLPKHSGYPKSQWAFTAAVLKGLRSRQKIT
ncbi:MAG: GFA family protein [Pseudomonadota bacterium]